MGIDLDAQPNVHLDTEVRELKSPRAFCAPVRVPDEIYLVVLPHGGQDDYGMLLHEAGHTEHFAHVRPDLAFEYRHLGDNAVTEGFAFTFDHLLLNRRWLAEILDFEDSDDYVRFAAVNDLYFMRRYAAKLGLRDHAARADGLARGHAGRVQPPAQLATKVTVPEENYLADVDDGFYCASYLRAWMLEGALRLMLQENFGMDWYASRDAGDWLHGALGARASTSRPSGCCCGTAAAGSTPTRCGTCSSRCSALTLPPAAQAGRNVTSTRRRRGPSNSAK